MKTSPGWMVLLKGAGQVMFCEHPTSGALFLLGVAGGALAAGQPAVIAGAVLGLLVSTAAGIWLQTDQGTLNAGLCGYNGLLVGAALATFLAPCLTLWLLIVLAAAASTVALMAAARVLGLMSAPTLTLPFVLATWTVLLAAYDLKAIALATPTSPHLLAQSSQGVVWGLEAKFWLGALGSGVSQVFLINSGWVGVIFLAALAVTSRWAAGLAVLGSAVGALLAWALGADNNAIGNGLWGFNPVLTALALGCIFRPAGPRSLALAVFGAVVTALVQGAMQHLTMPFQVPVLTMPFVLVTWLFLLANPRPETRP